jgi:LPPG:FO 2-phospho-L-lactate transferase
MITTLAGGVGAARFLQGLVQVVPPQQITVISNTGDDVEFYGLHVSPDIDIVLYTLAGIVDETKGWGLRGDTFHTLEMLKQYGEEHWFLLGDKDLATHIHRTYRRKLGWTLTAVTASLSQALGVTVKILPMCEGRVITKVQTTEGVFDFQDYFVRRGARDTVTGVCYAGIAFARPAPGVLEAIYEAEGIILAPSNPLVSLGTILSVPGVREALCHTPAPVVAISPIIQGKPIKGPADKLMQGLGIEVSAYGIATCYQDFLDCLVIDIADAGLRARIEALGIRVVVTNTIMQRLEDKIALANTTMMAVRGKE